MTQLRKKCVECGAKEEFKQKMGRGIAGINRHWRGLVRATCLGSLPAKPEHCTTTPIIL